MVNESEIEQINKLLYDFQMSIIQTYDNDLPYRRNVIEQAKARDKILTLLAQAHDEGARMEHDRIYALYNQMFESNDGFRSFGSLKPNDIMAFFERLKGMEAAIDKSSKGEQ